MKKKSRDRLSTLEILKLLKRNYNKFPKRYSLDIVVNVLPTGGVSMLA
jgi:hypothetical protein